MLFVGKSLILEYRNFLQISWMGEHLTASSPIYITIYSQAHIFPFYCQPLRYLHFKQIYVRYLRCLFKSQWHVCVYVVLRKSVSVRFRKNPKQDPKLKKNKAGKKSLGPHGQRLAHGRSWLGTCFTYWHRPWTRHDLRKVSTVYKDKSPIFIMVYSFMCTIKQFRKIWTKI